jgi:AcrR family transcriptional regulator
MPVNHQSRKTRILASAERCFAASGFASASLRQIVAGARVNLATVYYYFGSKEGLVIEVIKRRFDPLRAQNLSLLEAAIRESAPNSPPVEKILHAMLRPLLELAQSGSQESLIVLGLVGRMWTEPEETIQQLLREEFSEVRARFFEAFQFACPELGKPDLHWRIETVRASVCAILCNMRRIKEVTGGVCDPADASSVMGHLIPFFATGFRAPAMETKGRNQPARSQAKPPLSLHP